MPDSDKSLVEAQATAIDLPTTAKGVFSWGLSAIVLNVGVWPN